MNTMTATLLVKSSMNGDCRKKKPYKELTLEEKVQLIRLASNNPGLSQASMAEKYEIAKSNVCRILQRKNEYLRAFESAGFSGSRKRKLRSDTDITAMIESSRIASTSESDCGSDRQGNETLRAHMYKQHQISRMFMCRCCNWAFPDKTSLHMHMQAKEEGKSISVPIIGKGGAGNSLGPMQMAQMSSLMSSVHQPMNMSDNGFIGSSSGNIFPPLSMVPQRNDDLMAKLRERFMLNSMVAQSGINLAAWLANFPKVDASGVGSLGGSLNLRSDDQADSSDQKDGDHEMKDEQNGDHETSTELASDGDEDEPLIISDESDQANEGIATAPSDTSDEQKDAIAENPQPQQLLLSGLAHMPALRSAISASPLNSLLYKKRLDTALRRKTLDHALFSLSEQHANQHANGQNGSNGTNNNGSESRDASHVSPSETHSSASPPSDGSCYECSMLKGKLAVTQNRCRYLEGRTATLQTDALRFSARASGSETNARQFERESRLLREQNETLQRKLLECQEKTLNFLQSDMQANSKAVSNFLNEILQTTFLG